MKILPEFDFDINVKEIPNDSVKELQSTSGNPGKKFPYHCASVLAR